MPQCPAVDGSSPRQTQFDGPFDMCIDASKRYEAKIDTNYGEMIVSLDAVNAPKTVNNFVSLARYHYYDGLTFHRVIETFMIQGGCPEGSGRGGPGYRFEDELPAPNSYKLGSLAMANAGPDTNGSQFFIVSGPSGVSLPPNYSLFGQVVKGMEVVEKIEQVSTDAGDKPYDDVIINSVSIIEKDS